jgi:hypothetical protein
MDEQEGHSQNLPEKNQAAMELGRLGGAARTEKKRLAAQKNGACGGRPRIKIQKARKLTRFLPMQEQEVWALIPQELITALTSKQLALVAEAINSSYHNGRASTGADVIDANTSDGAVFVNCLEKAIYWKQEKEGLVCWIEK